MWTKEQSDRLEGLLEEQRKDPENVWVGYWNSDQFGRPANSGSGVTASPGVIHELTGDLKICSNGLHATREPHKWKGYRVWIVALIGKRVDQGNKSAGVRREIIGEVLPEECLDARIGVRIGRKDLGGADLERANLSGANLYGANLRGANLERANLERANLERANLERANLGGAYLVGANLERANLRGANLERANLWGANLVVADLYEANLEGAYLIGANLIGANLFRCYLGVNERPKWLDERYKIENGYIL